MDENNAIVVSVLGIIIGLLIFAMTLCNYFVTQFKNKSWVLSVQYQYCISHTPLNVDRPSNCVHILDEIK